MVNDVAAENFWGDIVGQISGAHVDVTSIIKDPTADPHQYESDAPGRRGRGWRPGGEEWRGLRRRDRQAALDDVEARALRALGRGSAAPHGRRRESALLVRPPAAPERARRRVDRRRRHRRARGECAGTRHCDRCRTGVRLGVGVLLPSDYHGFATAATNILLGNIFGASNSRSLPPTAGSC